MVGRRRHRRNPRGRGGAISLRSPLKAVAAGFKPSSIVEVLPMAAGAFGNYALRTAIGRKWPVTATGVGSYAVGLGGAGLMLLVPKFGPKLFAGAIVEEILRAVTQYVAPGVRMLGEYLMNDTQQVGMREFLEDNTARAGGDINLGDFLDDGQKPVDMDLGIGR